MAFEDEDHWPANPWQAQAEAHLLQLCASETFFAPCGLVQRLHDLEGQLAAAEAAAASQSCELQEARGELEVLRHRRTPAAGGEELVDLREKNDFLQVLMSRFERKVMVLEEENAKLTLQVRRRAPECDASTQAEDLWVHELEGQLALVEGLLRSKEHELEEVKEKLKQEQQSRSKFLSAAKGRSPQELMAEVEALESRNSFLSDLVGRFEDKTMMMEKQAKTLGASEEELPEKLAKCKKEQEEAKVRAQEELRASLAKQQQLKEEAKGMALTLRDLKREHNKRVQELLRQRAEAKTRMAKEACGQERKDLAEVKELKELNAQLVERLSRERSEHAETKNRLDMSIKETETLKLRTASLREQLIQLAELNDDLEERMASG